MSGPQPIGGELARLSTWDLVAKREAVAQVVAIPIERIVAELDGSITIAYPNPLSPIEQANLAAQIETSCPGTKVKISLPAPPRARPELPRGPVPGGFGFDRFMGGIPTRPALPSKRR